MLLLPLQSFHQTLHIISDVACGRHNGIKIGFCVEIYGTLLRCEAGLTKKNLPRGNWRLLTEQEIINLKNV